MNWMISAHFIIFHSVIFGIIGISVPINFINYCINKYLFPFDERSTILESISKNKIDINQDYTLGLQTYERNIQNIINLCLNNKIKVILSTFCIYLYPKIKNDPLHQLYQKIVFKENEIIRGGGEGFFFLG